MKTIPNRVCRCLAAFLLLFLGQAATSAGSPYQNKECNYKNLFTVKAKVTHNSGRCTQKDKAEPHYFTSISAVILPSDAREFLLEQGEFTGETFYAEIQNKAATLDVPLVCDYINEVFGTEFENPDIEDFYVLLSIGHKYYNSSGSSQTILNENLNKPQQWTLLNNPIPIDGFQAISPSRPVLVKLTELLSGKLTAYSDNPTCEQIEISLETKCKFVINQQQTIYQGYPYRISLSAEAQCSTNTFIATPNEYTAARDFSYTSGMFRWEYTHADTDTYLPMESKGKSVTVSPSGSIPVGKNILVRIIDGRSGNSENTKNICFYPNLPQPTQTKFQRIPDGATRLDVLRLVFNRSFSKAPEEKPTLLTVYSKVAQKADGSIVPGESTIIFQEAFNMANLNGTIYTTSVSGYDMKEGTYYATVEGTVGKQSNNPGSNGTLPNDIRNAMFKVVAFGVGTNDFEVEKVEFTPPKCFGQKGKLKVTLNEYFIPLVSQYPVFYYLRNPGKRGLEYYDTISFRCTYIGTQANPHATFECDYIGPQHSMFKIVIPSLISKGSTEKDIGIKTSDKGLPNDTYNERVSHFSIVFSQPQPLRVPVAVRHLSGYYCTDGTLSMAEDGQVTVFRSMASGGTAPYTFSFRDDYLNQSQTALNSDVIPAAHAGYRYIRVQDKNACRFDTTVFVSNLNTELCAEISVERNISCYNANDGILSVSLKKQSGNALQFSWYRNDTLLPGETGTTLYRLGPGTYKVVVTDLATGMTSSDKAILAQPSQLKLKLQQKTDIKCFGDHSGSIALSGSGGTPSYLYLWNGISYGSSRHDLPAGNYEVKLIDHNSCEITQTYTIGQPQAAFEISIDSVIHAYYNASEELVPGKILLHSQGGTKPYGALNSGGVNPNSLRAGTYRFQQSDANGCKDEKEVEVESFDRMRIQIVQERYNLCYGERKAACRVIIEGGVPPFNIQWSNGETQAFIEDLAAGTYSVCVQDAVGVVRTAETGIFQPELLQMDSLYVQHPAYHGCIDSICLPNEKNGEIHFKVRGGSAPYTFQFSRDGADIALNADSNRIENLPAGNYLIKAQDSNGCTVQHNFHLADIPPLRVETEIQQGIDCHNAANGILKARAYGGTPPYRYAWEDLPDSGEMAANLPSGLYTATVSDALGIKAKASLYLPQPEPIRITADSVRQPSYPGSKDGMAFERQNNGKIQVDVSGGTPPYRYEWFKDEEKLEHNGPKITELSAGSYRLLLTDANGCTAETSFNFPHIEALLCSISIEKPVSCFGMEDALLSAHIQGGVAPYSIRWIAGDSDTVGSESILSNRESGTYTLYVSDSNKVESLYEIFIPQPDRLQAAIAVETSLCAQDSTGKAFALVQGGTRPYRHTWIIDNTETDITDSAIYHLENAALQLHVLDEQGCRAEAAAIVRAPNPLQAEHTSLNPSYKGSRWQYTEALENDGRIELFASGGTAPYRYLWHNGADSPVLEALDSGTYRVTLTDSNGCSIDKQIELQRTPNLITALQLLDEPSYSHFQPAVFRLSVQGGKPPYTFDWYKNGLWIGDDSVSLKTGMGSGLYKVFVRDANGVSSCDSIAIDVDSILANHLHLKLWQTNAIRCFGEHTASVELEILNGEAPFSIQWSNGMDTPKIEDIGAGLYTVVVSDAIGWRDTGSIVIREPERLQNHITTQEPSCSGFADGSIKVQTTGGNGYYTYMWNTGERTPVRSHLAKGSYIVQVSDRLQCSQTDTVILNEPLPLQCILQVDSIRCPDGKGRIAWSAEGGTLPYRHHWMRQGMKENGHNSEDGDKPLIELADAGLYKLNISDGHNCRLDTSILLVNPKIPAYTLASERSLCAGQVLNLKAEGCDTIANLQYLWIYPDGKTSEQAEIATDMAGTHHLTLIQNKECVYHDSVHVTPFPDSIHVEFWVSSQITAKQSCLLVNLSEYQPDSIAWHIPQNVKMISQEGSYLEILFPGAGIYTVGLTSFKGLCYESVFRQIEVFEEQNKSHRESEKHSVHWSVAPNPTKSNCTLGGESDQPHSVRYRLVQASTGKVLEQGTFALPKHTRISRTVFSGNETAGMYILILEYGKERHSFKIVKL